MGHQNNDKKFELEMELFLNLGPPEILNLGPPERQCVGQPLNFKGCFSRPPIRSA